MCKEIFDIKSYIGESGEEFVLNYYLTTKDSSEEGQKKLYGIEANLVCDNIVQEKEIIDAITYDKDEMLLLLKKISEGLVTPYTLAEVLDNL